jgi:hypothetical protein
MKNSIAHAIEGEEIDVGLWWFRDLHSGVGSKIRERNGGQQTLVAQHVIWLPLPVGNFQAKFFRGQSGPTST